jgi:hypothetical protein
MTYNEDGENKIEGSKRKTICSLIIKEIDRPQALARLTFPSSARHTSNNHLGISDRLGYYSASQELNSPSSSLAPSIWNVRANQLKV